MNSIRSSYAPRGGKNAKWPFSAKKRTLLEESLLQSLCEYCQLQSCQAFTGLSIHAKIIPAGSPTLRENLVETDVSPS